MVESSVTTSAIVQLARIAGAAIMEHYHESIEVEQKADHTPLTLADRASHRAIVSGLETLDPLTPVISEEGIVPDYQVRRTWPRFWLVDPLDGTKEFIKRNGEFTVNICLIEGGEPVLGVVSAPAMDTVYWAARGEGSWRQRGRGTPERIYSTPCDETRPVTIVESRSHPSPELEHYLGTLTVSRRVRIGSSLKFCSVAEGTADLYPRLGPTMEWDVGAGDCVFRYSARTGQRHSPLTYNKPDLRNERFIIGL